MIKVITRIFVEKKSAEQITDWLFNLNKERYLQWHPAHKNYRAIKITEALIGSIFYFDEIINGHRINFEWVVVDAKKDEFLLSKAMFLYPVFLLLSLNATNEGTRVMHELRLGFVWNGIEKPFDWLISKFVFTDKMANSLNRHATEEFKNLERLIS